MAILEVAAERKTFSRFRSLEAGEVEDIEEGVVAILGQEIGKEGRNKDKRESFHLERG